MNLRKYQANVKSAHRNQSPNIVARGNGTIKSLRLSENYFFRQKTHSDEERDPEHPKPLKPRAMSRANASSWHIWYEESGTPKRHVHCSCVRAVWVMCGMRTFVNHSVKNGRSVMFGNLGEPKLLPKQQTSMLSSLSVLPDPFVDRRPRSAST